MTDKPVNQLHRSTLLVLMGAVFFGYFIAVHFFGRARAIEVGNLMLASAGMGLVLTYTPSASAILRYRMLDGATVLAFGIWIGWLSISYRTGGAILWRYFDKPEGWLDSVLWGLHIIGSLCSAISHYLGPSAINGRVPTKQWIVFGAILAGTIFMAGLYIVLDD